MKNKYFLKEVISLPNSCLPIHALYWEIDIFCRTNNRQSSIFYETEDFIMMTNYKPTNNIYSFNEAFENEDTI